MIIGQASGYVAIVAVGPYTINAAAKNIKYAMLHMKIPF